LRLLTADEMREIDRRAITEYGISGLVLMENAGLRVVEHVGRMLGPVAGKQVVVLAGKGNNGGDALVAARHLVQRGARVRVFFDGDPGKGTGDAAINLEIWRRLGQRLHLLSDRNALQALQLALIKADLVVDGLYGTGFRGEIRDRARRAVEIVNEAGKPVVAVDIPSGVEADTGAVRGLAVKADRTVCFGLPKIGLVLEPGASYAGELHIADISLPQALLAGGPGGRFLLTAALLRDWLPKRQREAHKGDFGHVFVVGGARGMLGAAFLAAKAAARSGAGLVTLGLPRSLQETAAGMLPEVMTLGLAETEAGSLHKMAGEQIRDYLGRVTTLVLGPGLSTHPETVALVREILPEVRVPCVLDADGLNAFELRRQYRDEPVNFPLQEEVPLVITPHPGEMARLLVQDTRAIQGDRLGTAERAAGEWRCTVVLKGARTIVALPDGQTFINPTGNPGMATGGSGDVLAGMIGGLLAQGIPPGRAAAAAVYLHGRAGDLAAVEKGPASLMAGDLLEKLPEAFKEVQE